MPETFTEFLKIAGGGGLLFLIFYIYHKSTTEQFNVIIRQTFELLKTMIEQNTAQLAYLQEINTKVSNNIWCPLVRKSTGHHKIKEEQDD